MKRKSNYYLITVIALCILLMIGCKNNVNKDETVEPTGTNVENVTSMPNNPDSNIGNIYKDITITPQVVDTKEIFIYSIDADTVEKEAVTALVPSDSEITPKLIVDMVVDAMADESFMIGIDTVTTEGDKVIVSFKDDQPPVINVGSSAEGEILDAIAQSLLDNLKDYNKVVFRIMGEAYSTGHFLFDLNHIYMEKSN